MEQTVSSSGVGPDGVVVRVGDIARLMGVLLPVLVVGWMSSALANRLLFAVWGILVASGVAWLWRYRWRLPVGAWVTPTLLAWLAIGWASFAWMLVGSQEIFVLASRAFLPVFHGAFWTSPSTYLMVAGLLALLAIVSFMRAR